MRTFLIKAIAFIIPFLSGCVYNNPVKVNNISDIKNTIAVISNIDNGKLISSGTGVAVAEKDGYVYILTAYHVVDRSLLGVLYPDSNILVDTHEEVEIVKVDEIADWAILKVYCGEDHYYKFPKFKMQRAELGSDASIYAYKYDERNIEEFYWKGYISAINYDYKGSSWIVFNGGVLRGNSGGPLLNDKNELIGLVSGYGSAYGNLLGTCILCTPAHRIYEELQDAIQYPFSQ